MTEEAKKVSRYDWLMANLNEQSEREALMREYDAFVAGPSDETPEDIKADIERQFEHNLENLHGYVNSRNPKMSAELSRAFSWTYCVAGAGYWEGVWQKYWDIQQAAVRARIQAMADESKQIAADSAAHMKQMESDVAEAKTILTENEKMIAETEKQLLRSQKPADDSDGA